MSENPLELSEQEMIDRYIAPAAKQFADDWRKANEDKNEPEIRRLIGIARGLGVPDIYLLESRLTDEQLREFCYIPPKP